MSIMRPSPPPEPSSEIQAAKRAFTDLAVKEYCKSATHARAWHDYFKAWAEDRNAPLLIRRSSPVWMYELKGIDVIFCDNSPAHWSFVKADNGAPKLPFSHDEAIRLIKEEIPLHATLSKKERDEIEKEHPGYEKVKILWKGPYDLGARGWRVDHLKDVGVKRRQKELDKLSRDNLKKHFLRLVSPANIVLTPKTLAGLGEMEEYRHAVLQRRPDYIKDLGDD